MVALFSLFSHFNYLFMKNLLLKISFVMMVAIAFTACASSKGCPTTNPKYFTK